MRGPGTGDDSREARADLRQDTQHLLREGCRTSGATRVKDSGGERGSGGISGNRVPSRGISTRMVPRARECLGFLSACKRASVAEDEQGGSGGKGL